jgi:Antirepressor regulating drug resistance, predicted signal transduction N-terminal membrane component
VNHERAHIARRDHLVKPLGFIIASIYWFNPLVWAAYILLCRDIELACDEKVIKKIGYDKKKDYSQALLNLSIPRKYISACPVAFGELGVNERVKNVLKMKKGKKDNSRGSACCMRNIRL